MPKAFSTIMASANIINYNAILYYNDEEFGPGYVISPYASPGTLYILHMSESDCFMLSLRGISCIETDPLVYDNNTLNFKSFDLNRHTVDKIRTIATSILQENNWLYEQLNKS